MNKIFKYILTFVAVFSFAACDNYDNFYSEEYASVVRLSIFGEKTFTVPASTPQTNIEFNVLRSGYDINRSGLAVVRVMTDQEWQKYASTYGVQRYHKLPSDCFILGENDSFKISFAPNDFSVDVTVAVSSEKLGDFADSLPPPINTGKEWANVIVLPLVLEAETGSVYRDQKNLLLLLEYDKNN